MRPDSGASISLLKGQAIEPHGLEPPTGQGHPQESQDDVKEPHNSEIDGLIGGTVTGDVQDINLAFEGLSHSADEGANQVEQNLTATNSFPMVPPLPEISKNDIQSLPRSQAEAIVEEQDGRILQEDPFAASESGGLAGDVWKDSIPEDAGDADMGFFTRDPNTGDPQEVQGQEADARFEEGIPLVPEINTDSATVDPSLSDGDSPSRIDENFNGPSEQENPAVYTNTPPLDRKSTAQVIGSLHINAQHPIDAEQTQQGSTYAHDGSALETEPWMRPDFVEPEEVDQQHQAEADDNSPKAKTEQEDLAALWKAALDDDEVLDQPEHSADPSVFFEDDGEGFLEDTDGEAQHYEVFAHDSTTKPVDLSRGSNQRIISSKTYVPISGRSAAPSSTPHNNQQAMDRASNPALPTNPSIYMQGPNSFSGEVPTPSRPQIKESAQSFVDKSKGGYQSPYDLPMDVTRPKKRAPIAPKATSQSTSGNNRQAPPPRRSSILAPQMSNHVVHPASSTQPSLEQHPPAPARPASSAGSFFEDLPSSKPRPSSSRVGRYSPPVPQVGTSSVPPLSRVATQNIPKQSASAKTSLSGQDYTLLPPEKLSLYDEPSLGPPKQQPVPALNSRYSPAPFKTNSVPPPSNRYTASPMIAPRPPSSHALPHQPRTSSPLTYGALPSHQTSHGSSHDSKGIVSGSTTDERSMAPSHKGQDDPFATQNSAKTLPPPNRALEHQSRQQLYDHSPTSDQYRAPPKSRTPPTSSRHSYAPVSHPSLPSLNSTNIDATYEQADPHHNYAPAVIGSSHPTVNHTGGIHIQPSSRNHDQQSNVYGSIPTMVDASLQKAQKGPDFEYIKPADGRELDSLERWKGCPIFAFGFGGKSLKMFPQHVPRFAAGQKVPVIKCSPGEVKVESEKTFKLEDSIATFPGPLKNKGKKKEVLDWIDHKLQRMENTSPGTEEALGLTTSRDVKHREEKVLLWRINRLLVQYDGVLEGSSEAEKAVRTVLAPNEVDRGALILGSRKRAASSSTKQDPQTHIHFREIRKNLLQGEREAAVWYAVDHGLWAHAMMISSTLSENVAKQVAQEFVRKEVNGYGDNTESLAALYQIFSGNREESVDELVPPSARAGMQMVSKTDLGPTKNALDGLDRWRETLTMILSNRTPDDSKAIVALGQLLASYGRVEAAHICFVFAQTPSLFGGPDEPNASVALLGSDHIRQPFDYGRDFDSILLTEVHDFARSLLSSSSSASTLSPHLQSYRLYHGSILAEHGNKADAQNYCDAIITTLKSTTRPSPYYHSLLIGSLEALQDRLRQAPRDSSGSWISKPSIDKVSGSIWAKFNSYVAGDEDDAASTSSKAADPAAGPFAGVTGESSALARTQSSGDLYGDAYQGQEPRNFGTAYPPNASYASSGLYTPRPSLEQQRQPNVASRKPLAGDPFRSDGPLHREIPRPASSTGVAARSSTNPPRSSTYAPRSRAYSPKPPNQPISETKPETSYFPKQELVQPANTSFSPPISSPDVPHGSAERMSYQDSTRVMEQDAQQNLNDYSPYPTQPLHRVENELNDSYQSYEQRNSSYDTQLPSNGMPTDDQGTYGDASIPSYEAPSFYAPPIDEAPPYEEENDTSMMKPRKSIMDLDKVDDFEARAAALRKEEKARKDREADEAFRKAAEADAQRDKAPKLNSKKSWFGGGWFGGSKEKAAEANNPNAPVKVKLGEESSFYFDKELGKWVNKKGGASDVPAAPTPPPPRGPPSRAVSAAAGPPARSTLTPPVPPLPSGPAMASLANRAVSGPAFPASPLSSQPPNTPSPPVDREQTGTPANAGSGPPSGPPSRPATGQGAPSNIDDLLGVPQARKGGTVKKGKKGRGYVDVMAK